MKNKPLLPSLKEKKRYLMFEVMSSQEPEPANVFSSISESAKRTLGELELGKAGLVILKDRYDVQTRKGLVKVSHKYVDKLRLSLALITRIGTQRAVVRTVGASGILRKAQGIKEPR